jgi:hypothetical protein
MSKFSSNGLKITLFTTFLIILPLVFLLDILSINSISFGYQEYVFVQNWARNNEMPKISEIHDVLATKDFVFVPDYENHNMKKFTKNGTFISEWGEEGTNTGQFDTPHSMDVDSRGFLCVSDMNNKHIQKFDSNGSFIIEWGLAGEGAGEFLHPHGIAIDSNDDVYVADTEISDI